MHRPSYAQAFAEQTGAHSECVARRLARGLWELWRGIREPYPGSGRYPSRSRELIDLVDAMAAFRVPCPAEQERELRARLASRREPLAIYERWREAQAELTPIELPEELTERELLEEVFSPFEEEFAGAIAAEQLAGLERYERNPASRTLRYDLRVAREMPTPPELRWAVRAMR